MVHDKKNTNGQAMISLLFFCLVGLTVAISSIFILISNSKSATQVQVNQDIISASENGIEIALVKLLRNPEYQGETFMVENISVVVVVNGNTINSTATENMTSHTASAIFGYNDNRLTLQSWTLN